MASNGQHSAGGTDTGAGFMGLIGGAILIFAIIYSIVMWTNSRYKSHESAAGAAATSSLVLEQPFLA